MGDQGPEYIIFEEEPTDQEIAWFATKLGIRPKTDSKFLYLAREGTIDSNRIDHPAARRLASGQRP